jgi:hypothetical protein
MSKSLKVQIIEKARALIEDERRWCRSELAKDAKGNSMDPTDRRVVRRCGLGALMAAAYEITNDHRRAQDLAITALRPTCGSSTLVEVNDIRGHAAVLALFDEASAAM